MAVECETEMNIEGFEGAPVKAAPATRRRAARPTPQQSGVPPPPDDAPLQVSPREETATETDDARILPEFDVVHA